MSERLPTLIELHLAGALSADQREELEQHLRSDAEAADAFARLTRLEGDLIGSFQQASKTRAMFDQLQSLARRVQRPRPRMRARDWRALAVAAAVFVALGAGLLLQWHWPSDLPTTPEPQAKRFPPDPKVIQVAAGQVQVNGQPRQVAHIGDRLRTSSDRAAVLNLPDGSQAELDLASEVVFVGAVGAVRQVVELVDGTGVFKVEPGEGSFQVETPAGRVTALGAHFRVRLRTQAEARERVFPGTRIAGLSVLVFSGVVDVEIGPRSTTLYAGDDRLFLPARESSRAVREMLTVLERVEAHQLVLAHGERRQLTRVPRAADLRIVVDGKPGAADQLKPGMMVYLQRLVDDDEIVGLRIEGPTIQGLLKNFDAETQTLTLTRAGREAASSATYPLAAHARVHLDGRAKRLEDLPAGSPVMVRLTADASAIVQVMLPQRGEGSRRK